MKRLFLICTFLIVVFSLYGQSDVFDFEAAWEEVYRMELQALPKSASQKVDSIYQAAIREGADPQRVKAVIYQVKFVQLLEEEARKKAVGRLESEISKSRQPVRNILKNMLARLYADIYYAERWKINKRTQLAQSGSGYETWDGQTFLNNTASFFTESIVFDSAFFETPLKDFELLLKPEKENRALRPWLIDLLAANALDFLDQNAATIKKPAQPFLMDNEALMALPEDFSKIVFTSTDPGSFQLKQLTIYQLLTRLHLEDAEPWALVDLTLRRMRFVKDEGTFLNKEGLYRQRLQDLKKLYADYEASAMIDLERAIYENELGASYQQGKFEKYQFNKAVALELCEEILAAFPNSHSASQAADLARSIREPQVGLTMEQYTLPDQAAKIRLEYKNHSHLSFTSYRMDYEAYQRFSDMDTDSLRQAFLDTLEVAQSWSADIKNELDYQNHSTEVLLPAHKNGSYLIAVTEGENAEELLAFDLLYVTRLAIVRAHDRYQTSFRVFDRLTGRSRPGVQVHLFTQGARAKEDSLDQRFITDENGEFSFSIREWYSRVHIELTAGSDRVRFPNNYFNGTITKPGKLEQDYNVQVDLFTDRAIYRPGQEVFFKAIVIKQQKSGSQVAPGEQLLVTLTDPNDQEVWSGQYVTNEFGSMAGSLRLPSSGLPGIYSFKVENTNYDSELFENAENSGIGRATIRVEEYKRPKFEIAFSPVVGVYHFGDSVTVEASVNSLAGTKITNAKVVYSVTRRVRMGVMRDFRYPGYAGDAVLLNRGELTTDDNGVLKVPFKALLSAEFFLDAEPTATYLINVDVTDVNGETRSAETSLQVGTNPYEISMNSKPKVKRNAGKTEFQVEIRSLNGVVQSLGGQFSIYRLQAPAFVKRDAPWSTPDYPGFSREEHDRLFPYLPYDGEQEMSQWKRSKVYEQLKVASGNEAKISIDSFSGWPSGYYLAEFVTKPEDADTLRSSAIFLLQDAHPVKVADNQLFEISLNQQTYKAGDKALLTFGTAAEELGLQLFIERQNGSVSHYSYQLHNEIKTLKIPIGQDDEGGISVFYYYAGYNDFKSEKLEIPVRYSRPSLTLEVGTFRDKLQPGTTEKWTFKVKGDRRRDSEAELLASMYDASLDQFVNHQWPYSPFQNGRIQSWSRINDFNSFSTSHFTALNWPHYFNPHNLSYDKLDWFGLSLQRPVQAQSRYVNDLRYRHNPLPVIKSGKKDLKPGIIEGRVLDSEGLPLPNTTISVEGLPLSKGTDEEGNFRIAASRGQFIYIRFVGYKTFRLEISEDNYYEISMVPDITKLDEVVVVGYGSEDKRALSYSIVEIADEEQLDEIVFDMQAIPETAALGARGISGDSKLAYDQWTPKNDASGALYIVDGVALANDSVNRNDVASADYLDGQEALALYGQRGANGVVIITTKAGAAKQNAMLAQVKSRTNLKETAFFFPQLRTNRRGKVSFEFETPESLTRWKLQLLAHNKKLANVLMVRPVITQKDLMLLPNAPRFLREGDAISFSAKVASLSTNVLTGSARLELFDAVSGQLLTNLIQEEEAPVFTLAPNGNASVSWGLQIPEGIQAVRYRVVAIAGDFSDGEENVIPVLTNRMLVQESVPLWAGANSTKTFSLDKLRAQQSTTLKHHSLTLTMTTNPVWEAIQNLPYLMEYPYECAEQTFARYYANSLGAHIVESFPTIQETFEKWAASGATVSKLEQNPELKALMIEETPWLREAQNQTAQQKRLSMLFESARMKEQLKASLDQLSNMQLSSGAFPWFAGSNRPNRYITQHIMAGLAHLKKLTGNSDVDAILGKGQAFMDQELISKYKEDMRRIAAGTTPPADIGFSQVQYLYVRSLLTAEEPSGELAAAVSFYQNEAFASWQKMDLQSQAMMAMFANSAGQAEVSDQIIRSLKEFSTSNPERGIYWKSNQVGWYNWEAPVETQALLIEAFETLTEDDAFIDGMKQWLLAEKRTKSWKTTKATTEAIYALLFRGLDWTAENDNVNVSLGGETVLQSESNEAAAGTGYFKKSWQADEIKREMADVVVENNGAAIAFGGLYWQYFEDLDKITEALGPLSLEKQLFKVTRGATGEELVAVEEGTLLALGDLVRVRIVLRSDRSMEFIHLKDMRASGFEPVNVLSGYKWQDGLGYYESTRDAATNFFIEYLPQGTFVFEYDLRVNNEGNFSNGITSIQNMYAPEFSSHSEGIRVTLGKR